MAAFQVVGHIGENVIALPILFPQLELEAGVVRQMQIFCDGNVEERNVLIAQTGAFFEIGRTLADAIFGQVRHGIMLTMNTATGRLEKSANSTFVAIKIYIKNRIRTYAGRTQENPIQELAALKFLNSNTIKQYAVLQDENNVYSVMEFFEGGELYAVVDRDGPVNETRARAYFAQVLAGLRSMHSMGVCHRDISLENILINSQGRVAIIDLGMSLRLPRHPESGAICLIPPQGRCGKLNYMSPEVLANIDPFDGTLTDIWALGVILFILLCGVPPVESASPLDQRFRMICDNRLGDLLHQWDMHLSPAAIDLLQKILKPVPSRRLTLEQISQHEWMHM